MGHGTHRFAHMYSSYCVLSHPRTTRAVPGTASASAGRRTGHGAGARPWRLKLLPGDWHERAPPVNGLLPKSVSSPLAVHRGRPGINYPVFRFGKSPSNPDILGKGTSRLNVCIFGAAAHVRPNSADMRSTARVLGVRAGSQTGKGS